MIVSSAPADHLLGRLLEDLRHASDLRGALAWQLLAIALCIGIAWGVSELLERRLQGGLARTPVAGAMLARPHIFRRLTWPLLALAALVLARILITRFFYHSNLMSLAIGVVLALALVRILLYALERAFPGNPQLGAFGRAAAVVIWLAVALDISGVTAEIVHVLDSMSLEVGRESISVWTVLRGLFWIFVAVLASLWAGSVIENRLMRADTLSSSLRVGLARLIRALLVVLGGLIVLPLVGIDLTVLSVFGGALGVGLGFGLQKIASNYVSGFIILFDHSVRIGDVITVENFLGKVRYITARYVILRADDGREAIVPNEKMITETVLNHSLEGRNARIAVTFHIGYREDLERVLALVRQTAADHPAVLAEPAPLTTVNRFSDHGIEVELGAWVLDAPGGPPIVKSEICVELWRRFRRSGIDIAVPQRDIRILGEPQGAAADESGAPPPAAGIPRRHGT